MVSQSTGDWPARVDDDSTDRWNELTLAARGEMRCASRSRITNWR